MAPVIPFIPLIATAMGIGGSAALANDASQKQKGENAKMRKAQTAENDRMLASVPNAGADAASAAMAGNLAGQQARKKALSAFGRSDTILTGSRGITDVAPTQRKTLLGL